MNGTLRSKWRFSGKSGPPPGVVLFDRSVRSDRNLPFRFQKKISSPVPLHLEVIEISVETKWNASVRLEILFLSNNVVSFPPDYLNWSLTGRSGIMESTRSFFFLTNGLLISSAAVERRLTSALMAGKIILAVLNTLSQMIVSLPVTLNCCLGPLHLIILN